MIKSKPCTVDGCSNPRFAKGYCQRHQNLRTDKKKPKGIRKISEKGIEKKALKKELVQNDMAFYLKLWLSRPHKCNFCGDDLGTKPKLYYFDHILEKQAFPKLRHDPENIQFLCLECHSNKTNGKAPDWFKASVIKLKEENKCGTQLDVQPVEGLSVKDCTPL